MTTNARDFMHQALLSLIAVFCLCAVNSADAQTNNGVRVRIETSMGSFVVQLDSARAPLTVANFLDYVRSGHYEETIFHRVINNFVIQGGGYDEKLVEKPTRANVVNESGNGLTNRRGTIGMARTGEPHSANAQFYISIADNPALDPQPGRWGYTVFGTVIEGMDVTDSIGGVATGQVGPLDKDAPLKPVVIKKIIEIK
jgi:peptidyl-prolyl cis-trans isomerase A (cyclophilin A)